MACHILRTDRRDLSDEEGSHREIDRILQMPSEVMKPREDLDVRDYRDRLVAAYFFFANGSKPNFWPPTLASNMRPPLPVVKTATPFWYLAFADAPLAAATALT